MRQRPGVRGRGRGGAAAANSGPFRDRRGRVGARAASPRRPHKSSRGLITGRRQRPRARRRRVAGPPGFDVRRNPAPRGGGAQKKEGLVVLRLAERRAAGARRRGAAARLRQALAGRRSLGFGRGGQGGAGAARRGRAVARRVVARGARRPRAPHRRRRRGRAVRGQGRRQASRREVDLGLAGSLLRPAATEQHARPGDAGVHPLARAAGLGQHHSRRQAGDHASADERRGAHRFDKNAPRLGRRVAARRRHGRGAHGLLEAPARLRALQGVAVRPVVLGAAARPVELDHRGD